MSHTTTLGYGAWGNEGIIGGTEFGFRGTQSNKPREELRTKIQRQVVGRDRLRCKKLGEMKKKGLKKIILLLSQQNTR